MCRAEVAASVSNPNPRHAHRDAISKSQLRDWNIHDSQKGRRCLSPSEAERLESSAPRLWQKGPYPAQPATDQSEPLWIDSMSTCDLSDLDILPRIHHLPCGPCVTPLPGCPRSSAIKLPAQCVLGNHVRVYVHVRSRKRRQALEQMTISASSAEDVEHVRRLA